MNKKKKILKRERKKKRKKKTDVGWSSSSVTMENRNSRLRVLTAIIKKNKVELPYVTHKDRINNTERQNKSTVKDRINRRMKTSISQNTHFLKPCDR